MADRAAAAAIQPSGARRCRWPVRGESRRRCARSGLDSLAHSQEARRPAARQQELPDVAIGDVEPLCAPLSRCRNEWNTSQAQPDSILGTRPISIRYRAIGAMRQGQLGSSATEAGRTRTSMHVRLAPKADKETDV